MRHRWAALFASCVVFAGALAGCAAGAEVADLPAPRADATCYRQSDLDNSTWERLDWEELSCYVEDSCHGGLGRYGGGCYKWARGPNAPPLPWSAEVTGDEPPGRPLPTDEGLPLEYGLFAIHTLCADTPNEACPTLRRRANAPLPIYAAPDPTSQRVGRINRDEVVVTLEHARFVAAQRGIADDTYRGMNPGDVVYAIEHVCKWETVWRRGDILYGIDTGVAWEPPQRLYNPSSGAWVRLERANGQRGWARASVLGRYLTAAEPPPPLPENEAGEFDEFDECE